MTTPCWYYCDANVDSDQAFGPVSLARLAELIRRGELPYDVLVSTEGTAEAKWVEADRIEQILQAIPIDRERLMREYIGYGEAPLGEANWGWASDRMYSLLVAIPELAWQVIVEMIERAPSHASLGFLAGSPLEGLLSKDGPAFIARVEQRAAENAKCRRALGMTRRLGMTDDVWRRVQRAARFGA
jgi:hypothetical protein